MPLYTRALLLPLFFISHVLSICYYPDGTTTASDVPCYDGDEASFCCGWGFVCLSNKVCMDPAPNTTSKYVRGSCTDQDWRSGNCPNFCVNPDEPNLDLMSGGEGMALCPGTDNVFYCYDFNLDNVDCDTKENIAFQSIGTPSILTTIGFGSSTATSQSATVVSSEVSSTPPPNTLTTSSTASTQASPTHSSSSTPKPKPSPTPVGTIAGAAIGGAAFLIIVVVAAVWFFRRKRHAQQAVPHSEQPAVQWSPQAPPYGPGNTYPKYQDIHELHTNAEPNELDGRAQVHELPSKSGYQPWR